MSGNSGQKDKIIQVPTSSITCSDFEISGHDPSSLSTEELTSTARLG